MLRPRRQPITQLNTTQFDDGDFWQLADTEDAVAVAAVMGLGLIALMYFQLLVLVLRFQARQKEIPRRRHQWLRGFLGRPGAIEPSPIGPPAHHITEAYYELVSQYGKNRKAYNLVMEVLEIVFQTINLHAMLSEGLTLSLVYAYVVLMAINCMSCFYHIVITWRQHAFYEMIGDAVLDVVFAVVFPCVTLACAIMEFRGGLLMMSIRQQYLPAKAYECRGRLYGDPGAINPFTVAFDSLRITGRVDLIVTVGFNLMEGLRWHRIVTTLQRKHRLSLPVSTQSKTHPRAITAASNSINNEPHTAASTQKRVVPAYVRIVFLIFKALIVLFVTMAIHSSAVAGSKLPHCVLHSYRWYPGAADQACPCLVYIEGHVIERFKSLDTVPDASVELAQAEAGSLRTIQLVNRALQGILPSNVKRCNELRQLYDFLRWEVHEREDI